MTPPIVDISTSIGPGVPYSYQYLQAEETISSTTSKTVPEPEDGTAVARGEATEWETTNFSGPWKIALGIGLTADGGLQDDTFQTLKSLASVSQSGETWQAKLVRVIGNDGFFDYFMEISKNGNVIESVNLGVGGLGFGGGNSQESVSAYPVKLIPSSQTQDIPNQGTLVTLHSATDVVHRDDHAAQVGATAAAAKD